MRRLEVGLVEAGPQPAGLVGLQAGPDVDELVGRVDGAQDALARGRVGRLGLDDQDVVRGQVGQREAAVGGGGDVELDAVERRGQHVGGDVDEGRGAGGASR